MKTKIMRMTAVAGAFAIAAGGLLAVAGPASAANPPASSTTLIGTAQLPPSANGKLQFSAATGDPTTAVTWSTTTSIGGSSAFAELQVETSNGFQQVTNAIGPNDANSSLTFANPITTQSGWSGGDLVDSILGAATATDNNVVNSSGATFEIWVASGDSSNNYTPVFDAFVTIFPDFSFQISATNPVGVGPVLATPAVTITAPTSGTTLAAAGTATTYTATVTGGSAPTGTVQFEDVTSGTPVNLGPAQSLASVGGVQTATLTGDTSLTTGGTHNIAAVYSGDAANSTETSGQIQVIVPSSTGQNITVQIPPFAGTFTYTFSQATVDLGTATHNATTHTFDASGALNPVTVHDARPQTTPGWAVSGAMGVFHLGGSATVTEPGNTLGWTPSIGTADNPAGINHGPIVAPNAPGLGGVITPNAATPGYDDTITSGGSELADAPHPAGQGNTELDASLQLAFPDSAPAGAYSGVLTLTAMTSK